MADLNGYVSLQLISADQIELKAIRWLWRGHLALGKFHLTAGVSGVGKSRISMALISTITNAGWKWPDGTINAEAGDALIWSNEDAYDDTLAPALKFMGANLKRVHFIDHLINVKTSKRARFFNPATDCEYLERALEKIEKPRYLHLDPVVAVMKDGKNSNANSDTRSSMAPVGEMAARWGFAANGITHFTKGTNGANPLERIAGSLAWGAVCRVAFGVAEMEDGGRVFARIKSNIGPQGGGFGYELEIADTAIGEVALVKWGSSVAGTGSQLLTNSTDDEPSLRELDLWLTDFIKSQGGCTPAKEAQLAGAGEFSCSERSIRRSAQRLRVVAERHGFGKGSSSMWRLP